MFLTAGVTKASTKDDGTEALLKHILGSDGKSQGDVDVESILARVADNDSDEHELASPTQVPCFLDFAGCI